MLTLFSPAKINLSLAVTGRRADGFHSLVSLVAPLTFGDELKIEESNEGVDQLLCEAPGIPLDEENLILRAADRFRRKVGEDRFFRFSLQKRIPAGGGFGGGSSNAVCALKGMNRLAGKPLGPEDLRELAAELGSDCPLFLREGPVVLRGRGEILEPVPAITAGLRDRAVFLFNPGFSSSTPELYLQLAGGNAYTDPEEAEARLALLQESIQAGRDAAPLQNDLGNLLAKKYLFYDTLFGLLRAAGITECGITGSGSGAFALVRGDSPRERVFEIVNQFLEEEVFMIETQFQGVNVEV